MVHPLLHGIGGPVVVEEDEEHPQPEDGGEDREQGEDRERFDAMELSEAPGGPAHEVVREFGA